jgi:tetratricopeptide (TPR) repeat protein
MKGNNLNYLIVGALFGFVAGLFLSYAIFFQKETALLEKPAQQAGMQQMQQPPEHMNIFEEIEKLKALLQEKPSDYPALVRLGNLYFDAVKYDKAMEYYSRAVEIRDDDPNVITDLGICYRYTKNPQKAMELFERANSIDPSHWQSLYNVVIVATNDLLDVRAAEEALHRLEKIQEDPKMIDFLKSGIENLKKKNE